MQSSPCRKSFLALVLVAFGLANHAHATETKSSQSSLNDGYSLFYDFCSQESQLSLLLWVKTTPKDIADFATRISAAAKDDMTILKQFGVDDQALKLNKISLPDFEQQVRASMATDRKQQLLWGTSGAAFAQAVCLTQSEVTNYGFHVAKILAETEPNPQRAVAMQKIFQKWSAFHAEAYRLAR